MVVKSVHYYKGSVKFILTDPLKVYADKELEVSLVKRNGTPMVVFTVDHVIVWYSGILP